MRQRKLGICDPDIRYAVSLMNYINADIGNSFLAFAFSTRESLSEYLTGNHLDLVLVAEDWMADAAFWDTYTELCVIGMSEHSAELFVSMKMQTRSFRISYVFFEPDVRACPVNCFVHMLLSHRLGVVGKQDYRSASVIWTR